MCFLAPKNKKKTKFGRPLTMSDFTNLVLELYVNVRSNIEDCWNSRVDQSETWSHYSNFYGAYSEIADLIVAPTYVNTIQWSTLSKHLSPTEVNKLYWTVPNHHGFQYCPAYLRAQYLVLCYFSYMLMTSQTIFLPRFICLLTTASSTSKSGHPVIVHHPSRIFPDSATGLSPGRWFSIQSSVTFWASRVNVTEQL